MAGFCTNCATALEPGAKFCPACGASKVTSAATPPPPPARTRTLSAGASQISFPGAGGKRYPALRIVAIVLKVAAVLWLIIGIIAAIAVSSGPFGAAGGAYSLLGLLASVYFAVMSWATAELLHVFMDIEENTRRAAAR